MKGSGELFTTMDSTIQALYAICKVQCVGGLKCSAWAMLALYLI